MQCEVANVGWAIQDVVSCSCGRLGPHCTSAFTFCEFLRKIWSSIAGAGGGVMWTLHNSFNFIWNFKDKLNI
jgi:hypothetical protein